MITAPASRARGDRTSTSDLPLGESLPPANWSQLVPATILIGLPTVGTVLALVHFWGHGISWFDLVLAVSLYFISGLGVTIGFHRLLTHRGFEAARWLKVLLTICGTLALEGSAISWVSQHRRHHANSDKLGDPHTPWIYGSGARAMFRGFWHAHTGWLFVGHDDEPERWSAELLADRDITRVSAYTPQLMVLSLVIPFAIGYAVTGTLSGAVLALIWGGLVRVFVLHHVTWSINSICHIFGKRPFRSNDRSTNFAPLAILSFGESWHNAHHAFPSFARHGVDRGQIDISARIIRVFERFGWVREVKWPTAEKLALKRR